MTRYLELTRITHQAPVSQFVRVIYDWESAEWGYQSRTRTIVRETLPDGTKVYFSQLPAVYRYGPAPESNPGDHRVDETPMRGAYYSLNNYNTSKVYDGLGMYRCENFLFKDNTALYNNKGFPLRQYLTMSGNKLEVIEKSNGYVKFKTLKPSDNVNEMKGMDAFEKYPQFVHRFHIVQMRDNLTVTNPLMNRDGYLYYYLVSEGGVGYMPERYVKPI